jgi:ABC-2 type transport system ATP-binding protein
MPPVIEFERVTKVYQGRQIGLADVSFSLPAGSSVGLLGANGSGKSTAIRLAWGLIKPSGGEIRVFGEHMGPGAKVLRQRIGFLSDDPLYPKDLSAISYLSFVGKCFGLQNRERDGRMGTLLRAVGLMEDAGRKIGTYSTGMKTRLGIAASLMNDPELLIWQATSKASSNWPRPTKTARSAPPHRSGSMVPATCMVTFGEMLMLKHIRLRLSKKETACLKRPQT